MINKFKNKKGFTVLESIVAIFILSLSVSGAFSAVQQGLSQSIIAKDEVKAFYLAQEAVEIIRNKRDANQLAKINNPTVSWLAGIAENSGDPCYFGKVCRADAYAANSLVWCGDNFGSCPVLNQDLNQGSLHPYLYGYDSSWTATNFKREIQIESINANEISITVRVSWTKGILPLEFKAKTLLFNWI
jgi:prepilin-type N-terminal cleavage/methylation domain-containing protein